MRVLAVISTSCGRSVSVSPACAALTGCAHSAALSKLHSNRAISSRFQRSNSAPVQTVPPYRKTRSSEKCREEIYIVIRYNSLNEREPPSLRPTRGRPPGHPSRSGLVPLHSAQISPLQRKGSAPEWGHPPTASIDARDRR